jgi:hypothetical protein
VVNVTVVVPSVPPMLRFPAPEKVIWQPPVLDEADIAPDIVTVPVEIEIRSYLVDDVADIVSEPQERFPAPTLTVKVNPLLGLGIFRSPVIEIVFVPLIINALLAVTPPGKASDAHCAAATSTVTVIPLLIVTISADVGTDNPPQVAVLLQLPVTLAVRVAPFA